MAERTGHAELDALLERFKDEWVGRRPGELRVRKLADPGHAARLCNIVASQLAVFLRHAGYDAESCSEGGDFSITPDELGYGDRALCDGVDQHDVCLVALPDGAELMVDFTAAQYGYTEFPMVQREGLDSTWLRDWPELHIPRAQSPALMALDTQAAPGTAPPAVYGVMHPPLG